MKSIVVDFKTVMPELTNVIDLAGGNGERLR
jgi:hypothetical protein